MNALMLALALAADPADDWKTREAAHLKNIRPVTSDFVRAGEGYFSPDGKRIIFQAEEKGTGNPFYQIFVQDLATGPFRRISPGVGRTTCAYFRPDGKKVIFASSHEDPDAKKHQDEEYARRAADAEDGRPPAVLVGLRPAHEDLRGQPGRHRPEVPHPVGQGVHRRGELFGGRHARSCSAPGTAGNVEIFTMNADGTGAKTAHARPGLLQRRPVLQPGRHEGGVPGRPQGEGPAPAVRHQQRRDRRAGADGQRQVGVLGSVLVQGRQAHHLHRRRPLRPDWPGRTTTCTGWTRRRARRPA